MTNQITKPNNAATFVDVRKPKIDDAQAMHELAYRSGLDLNSQYSYLMMCEFFSSTCAVASVANLVAGFLTAFRLPESPSEVFVWQIAVAPGVRGQGVGSRMLDDVVDRLRTEGVEYVQATINPTNGASIHTFESLAERLECEITNRPMFRSGDFSGSGHEEEVLYRVGPF